MHVCVLQPVCELVHVNHLAACFIQIGGGSNACMV